MRVLIENVVPYPIDCEMRFGSIMAALLTSQDKNLPDGMQTCTSPHRKTGAVGEPCTRCGNCRGWSNAERYYLRLSNTYDFISGDALLQFDMSGTDPAMRDVRQMVSRGSGADYLFGSSEYQQMLSRGGDCLNYLFGYAGYQYHTIDASAGKETVFMAICDSIDHNIPVLLQYQADHLWLLVTGYDETMALYGYDGGSSAEFYQKMTPAPDSYDDKLFHATNWYEAMQRAVIMGEKSDPWISLDDVITRNAAVMQPIFDDDYYGRAARYIRDDGNFRDEETNLRTQAKLIGEFIGVPISARSIVSWFMFDHLNNNCEDKHRQLFNWVAGCCCDIHNICWVAWRGVGLFEPQSERFHAKLADSLYRKMLAEVVELVGIKDRQIYESLSKYAAKTAAAD